MVILSLTRFITSAVLRLIVTLSPAIELSDGFKNTIVDIFTMATYLLPIQGLALLFALSLALDGFLVFWRILMRMKSFIPTMGN